MQRIMDILYLGKKKTQYKEKSFECIDNFVNIKQENAMSCDTTLCCTIKFQTADHLKNIEYLLNEFTNIINQSSMQFAKMKVKGNKLKVIPGRNRNVKILFINVEEII